VEKTKEIMGIKMKNKMDIGFNIIEKSRYRTHIFKEKISIIGFLREIYRENRLPPNISIFGLEELLYSAENLEEISKKIRELLQDAANFFIKGNYIFQIVIAGKIEVVESSERPRIKYKDKEILIYPILGRVKQLDLKHFIAPLNLLS